MHLFKAIVVAIGLHSAVAALAAVVVSPGGQAGYSQAIAVPPGIAGMAPNLAFSYTDGGINGPVGVGWSVQGISTITRCPASKPTDTTSRTVHFDGHDKLCLDGQRLIQTEDDGKVAASQTSDAAGLAGATHREFRTEKDSQARIRAYGSIEGDTAKGPAYFKVWTKSGQIYHYGIFGTDAQALVRADPTGTGTPAVGAVWAVYRISDTLGNYIDFKYEQLTPTWGSGTAAAGRAGREWNVKEIHYTGAPGQAPANRIVFNYAQRSPDAAPGHDRAEAYQRGNKNLNLQLLQDVSSYVNATGTPVRVRVHKLGYERSTSSGRSRLTSITECAGTSDAKCLPATRFSYTTGGASDFGLDAAFGASSLATLKMLDASESRYGALTGDFNGDGRTDILRWAQAASENELHFSNGDGSFAKQSNFNITADSLFKNDGCYYALAADFNGDGMSDILRVAKSSCSPSTNLIFLSAGNGTFGKVTLASDIDLDQKLAVESSTVVMCVNPQRNPGPAQSSRRDRPAADPPAPTDERQAPRQDAAPVLPEAANCTRYNRGLGKNYHLLDFDGDGWLDIVTTVSPSYVWYSNWGFRPDEASLCEGELGHIGGCTKVFRGNGDGTFTEKGTMTYSNLYSAPPDPKDKSNPYWRRPHQGDINGDGLPDIFSRYAGAWRSNGDGSFTPGDIQDGSAYCPMPIDFNGDQRSDCLRTDSTAASQSLSMYYGATSSGALAQFNLTTAGNQLYARDSSDRQTIGAAVEDFNGDGRSDILRWGQNTSDNGIYFSKGDGSFHPRAAAGLGALPHPLQGVDRKSAFMLGDFLGNGTLQILHLKPGPVVPFQPQKPANELYTRVGGGLPSDLLATVTSSSGLVTTVGPRVTLGNSGGTYVTDRGTPLAGQGAIVDLQLPVYVIASLTQQTASADGGALTTQYQYHGLKAERGGRGMLGFRETRQQSPAPDGSAITVATTYLQKHPYLGVASVSQTYLGTLTDIGPSRLLSRTTYSYCDKTSLAGPVAIPDPPAPTEACGTEVKVTRPYLYQSVEEGWDLAGQALPKVTTTNTYNSALDPETITVVTTGTALGLAQTFTKTTSNLYFPDQTAGEQWILGRLQRSTVRNQVPNSLPAIATAAGSSPQATAQNGSGPPPAPATLPPEVLNVILQLLLDD